MISPDFLERLERTPDKVDSQETLAYGIATIKAVLEGTPKEVAQNSLWLSGGMMLTRLGLIEIRTKPEYSEAERFQAAIRVLGHVNFKRLPETMGQVELLSETMATLVAGQRTGIQHRIKECTEGFIRGNYELSALMVFLKDGYEGLTPLEQLTKLQNCGVWKPEDNRTVVLNWGRRLVREGMSDDDFSMVISHYFEQGDKEIVAELTTAKLEALSNGQEAK